MSTVSEYTHYVTNLLTGEIQAVPHKVITVANGLNYMDENGTWQEALELIEVLPDGSAAAVHGQAQVYFGPSLQTDLILATKNLTLTTRPYGLYFLDPQSEEVLLAERRDEAVGELITPNEISPISFCIRAY
jgi:hypothetical protein